MKLIGHRLSAGLIGLLAVFVMGGAVLAQTGNIEPSNSPAPATGTSQDSSLFISATSTTLAAFQQEQAALTQGLQALYSQGATFEQIEAWRQENSAQLQAQQQAAQLLSAQSALQPLPMITAPNFPSDASGSMQAFATTQADLVNANAQIYNQLLQALPANPSLQQVLQIKQQAAQIFFQQYGGYIPLQAQAAQTLSAASASQPLPVPGLPLIPPNATPQLAAYMTAHNALVAGWAQVWNQYRAADPATRQAAMQQWQQQNAGTLQQLQQQAPALSNPTATQEIQNQ